MLRTANAAPSKVPQWLHGSRVRLLGRRDELLVVRRADTRDGVPSGPRRPARLTPAARARARRNVVPCREVLVDERVQEPERRLARRKPHVVDERDDTGGGRRCAARTGHTCANTFFFVAAGGVAATAGLLAAGGTGRGDEIGDDGEVGGLPWVRVWLEIRVASGL